ncbi:MAG: crossover junction endodeoxyribonuclease RuvC [Candidatus Eremiobacteraeota bacterium]|nr:crossover junction endodeoxyribonuclease RuvC [Candidatus Eremiobacteraeota bacterium]MBV8497661.1 crossover junction endodeoxyribonuclease RuvC [Candidatus Eremiobacteraeota bacterium]
MPPAPVRVLGIDPALRTTGYGVIERRDGRVSLVEAGVVVPRSAGTLEQRLCELHAGIAEVIAATSPSLVVIEELYSTYKNPRSALLMGHARGVLCLASAQAGVAVHTLGHARVKRALVGSGSARKEQVSAMVARLLSLRRPPKPHDVSDALALALAFLNVLERPALHVR